jgi:hypothetical protein
MASIQEQTNKNNCVPHHLPSAMKTVHDLNGSVFFVVRYSDYLQLSNSTIQAIFKDRHILITEVPATSDISFDLYGLGTLAGIHQPIEIIGKFD